MKKSFWISFDFGLKGDYEGLYTFLDNNEALECVNNVAYFTFTCKTPDFATEVKNAIKATVRLSKNDRLYLIWRSEKGSVVGKFLNGGRKRAPWEGYGISSEKEHSDIAE